MEGAPDVESEYQEYLPRLQEDLEKIRISENFQKNSDALMFWSIKQVSPNLGEADIRHAMKVRNNNQLNLTAAWWDNKTKSKNLIEGAYIIGVSHSSDDLNYPWHPNVTYAEELYDNYMNLMEAPAKKLPQSLQTIKREVKSRLTQGFNVKLALILGGLASRELESEIRKLNTILGKGEYGDRLSIETFDIRKLHIHYIDRLEKGDLPLPDHSTFKVIGQYCHRVDGKAKSLIAEIPLSSIYSLVESHGLSLFAKNLRVPLGTSRFNRGIVRALNDKNEIKNFWFYNNGITAICDKFYFDDDHDIGDENFRIVHAEKLQIVNGCQTCSTVQGTIQDWKKKGGKYREKELDSVGVLLRLIQTTDITGHNIGQFAHSIARYTNSQNPITGRNLHSNDLEQMQLREAFSERGYFYEVKPKEWLRRREMDPTYHQNFARNPPIIDNEKAAQYYIAFWLHGPASAKHDKKQIFNDDGLYYPIFSLNKDPNTILLPWLLFQTIDDWRKKNNLVKRAKKGKRKKRFSKSLVFTYGDLYLVTMMGWGLQNLAIKNLITDRTKLKFACDNLIMINENEFARNSPYTRLEKSIYSSLDGQFKIMYNYAKNYHEGDQDLSLREILLAKSAWEEMLGNNQNAILKSVRNLDKLFSKL